MPKTVDNQVVLDHAELIHTRNKFVLKLLWYSLIASLGVDILGHVQLKFVFLLGISGTCSLALISYLVSKRLYIYQTMFMVVLALAFNTGLIILNSPILTNYPMVYFSLVVAALYQDYRPITLVGIFGICLTGYLFVTERDTMFHGMNGQDLMWFIIFIVLVSAILIVQAFYNDKLRREAEDKQKDAIAKGKLQELISQIIQSSQALAASSEQFSATLAQTNTSTEQIAATIEQISKGAQHQVSSIADTQVSVVDMVEYIGKTKIATDRMAEVTLDAAQRAENGGIAVNEAVKGMLDVKKSTEDVNTYIQALASKSDEIESVIELISEIAEQTNLLALNAAIESARAGEAGRGFAVVSEEIRRLAEKSQMSTRDISNLIGDVRKSVADAVNAMEAGYSVVSRTAETVGSAGVGFDVISKSIFQAKDEVLSIKQATDIIAQASEKVKSAVETIASIAEEASSSTEEVSAATQEQIASLEQLTASAKELSDMSQRLWQLGQTYENL